MRVVSIKVFTQSLDNCIVNMRFLSTMTQFVDSVLFYVISRVHIIFFFFFVFVLIRLFRILDKYNRMRRLTNLIPGIKCQNLILGNLQIITAGVNTETGVDAYQGMSCFCFSVSNSLILMLFKFIDLKNL